MLVTFTRTGERRYRVSVEGPEITTSWMEPAPGYDPLLPHDMAHFIAESSVGISGGVFGQLAAGGHAHTFHPVDPKSKTRSAKRGDRLAAASRADAELSENVVYATMRFWKGEDKEPRAVGKITAEQIRRIAAEYEAASAQWSKLPVGGEITFKWSGGKALKKGNK